MAMLKLNLGGAQGLWVTILPVRHRNPVDTCHDELPMTGPQVIVGHEFSAIGTENCISLSGDHAALGQS
jgi:hypothetical protein